MPRFLIEVPHEADTVACAKVVKVFLLTGSHFLTHADWGCMDGVHSAFLIVDLGDMQEARMILPPAFRADAKIVRLTTFKLEQINATLARHHAS
jgi:hypothetical protein